MKGNIMEEQTTPAKISLISRTKKFVSDHKVAIAIGATATVAFVAHRQTVKAWNEFLTEKGLLEEYYNPDELNIDL
jgi:hypothetical protein